MENNNGHQQVIEPCTSIKPALRFRDSYRFPRRLLLGLLLVIVLAPAPVRGASTVEDEAVIERSSEVTPWQDMGWGMGSVISTLVYSPLKIVYAGLGLVTSGLGFVLSAGNAHVATTILDSAIGGDYVVTPGHLKGEKKLAFMGARRYP